MLTLAHEFGHYVLHQKLKIGQTAYDHFEDSTYNYGTGKHDLVNPRHWIEWQANFFAASLVLPDVPFIAQKIKSQRHFGLPEGKIFLDDSLESSSDFRKLIGRLAYIFSVSKSTIIYKLNQLEFIENQSRVKTIGQIISEDGLL